MIDFNRIRKYYTIRLKRLKGDPGFLAGGVALGVFIGITPTIPLHTGLIILLALLTRTSAIAGILASWIICNPLTTVPIYYGALVVGNAITPYHISWAKIKSTIALLQGGESFQQSIELLWGLGYQTVVVMLVGGCILAIPFAIASYFLSLRFFIAIRRKRQEKRILR